MFIGREAELQFSENKYNSEKGQLIVLYGRRWTGKTTVRDTAGQRSGSVNEAGALACAS